MTRTSRMLGTALALAMMSITTIPVFAQDNPKQAVVSIYHVAPGKQLQFLQWMAAREAIDREAGVAATQWYVHISGDSWDYIAVSPEVDAATSQRIESMTRARGLKAGVQAGLEFRQMVASHTDTLSGGPYTAAELVARATAP